MILQHLKAVYLAIRHGVSAACELERDSVRLQVATLSRESKVEGIVAEIEAGRLSILDLKLGCTTSAERIAEHNDALAYRRQHEEGAVITTPERDHILAGTKECPACKGRGKRGVDPENGSPSFWVDCEPCKGSGQLPLYTW